MAVSALAAGLDGPWLLPEFRVGARRAVDAVLEAAGGGWRMERGRRVAAVCDAVLRALGDATGEIAARGPATGHSSDVRYAIAGGLTVRELDLIFERDERLWMATVSAENFDLKRVKLPELLSEEDSERVSERLTLIADLDGMLKASFAVFLHDRLTSRWQKQTIPALRDWLKRSILEEKYLGQQA